MLPGSMYCRELDLAPRLVDPVTDDARDPLARGRRAVHCAQADRFVEGHAGLSVAANAEVAVGAVGQLDERFLHGVEHGTYLRISVRRHRPLVELDLMAFRALLGRRERVVRETVRVGLVDRLLGDVVPDHRRGLRVRLQVAGGGGGRGGGGLWSGQGLVRQPWSPCEAQNDGRRGRHDEQGHGQWGEPAPTPQPSQATFHSFLLFPEVPTLQGVGVRRPVRGGVAPTYAPEPIAPGMKGGTGAVISRRGMIRRGETRKAYLIGMNYRVGPRRS